MAHWTEETFVDSPEVIGASVRRGITAAKENISDLLGLLERAGFSSVQLYGGLDGTALDRESSQLIVVAEP